MVNPDVIHDVTVHEIDRWSRPAPSRRHSIAVVSPSAAARDGEKLDLTASLPAFPNHKNKRSQSVSALLMDGSHDQKLVELRQKTLLKRQELELDEEGEGPEETGSLTTSWAAALLFGGVVLGSVLCSGSLQRYEFPAVLAAT